MSLAGELTLLTNAGDQDQQHGEQLPGRSFKPWHIAFVVASVCGIAISTYALFAPRVIQHDAATSHAIMRNDDPDANDGPKEQPLFDQLGGSYAVATVMDTFLNLIIVDPVLNANPHVNEAHHRVAVPGFKYLVWEVVSNATGGPIVYTGRDMKTAHAHLRITKDEWKAFAGDMVSTLNLFKVPETLQKQVLAIAGSLEPLVVNESPDKVEPPPPPDADVDPKSLYKRLGGIYSIATVTDTFINTIMKDPVLNANEKVNEAHHKVAPAGFKVLVAQLLGMATGGPQVYSGRSMKEAHKDLAITSKEWDVFATDFKNTLDLYKVPEKEQGELFDILGPLKDDVVTGD